MPASNKVQVSQHELMTILEAIDPELDNPNEVKSIHIAAGECRVTLYRLDVNGKKTSAGFNELLTHTVRYALP